MSKLLHISPKLSLPRDVVTSTLVVYGGKGMGKTNFGSVLVEEMTKASLRWAVLDPLGVWWGLRHSADGKGPGIECLIVGGLHGDLPLEPTAGAVVADLVAEEEGTNVVIDFSRKPSGEMWSMGEKIRFVTEYALRLFKRQGEITGNRRRSPLMQILDESARYIPQLIPTNQPELARCVGAWEQMTEEGRNVGLGVTFLTQRSARMNKSVSELADAMIAFRIVGPRSIEAVVDWLGAHVEKARQKDIIEQVRKLPVGQALVVSPGWLDVEAVVQMRMRETFDSSATPKPGERRREPGRAAKPDLEKYKVRMAETIERAKAEDPKLLRQRIQELEREAKKVKPAPVPARSGKAPAEHHPQDLKLIAALRQGLEDLMKVVIQINAQDFIAKVGESVDQEALQLAIARAADEAVKLVDRALDGRRSQLDQLRRESQRVVARLKKLVDVDTNELQVEVNVRHQEPFAITRATPPRSLRPLPKRQGPTSGETNGRRPRSGARRMLEAIARRYPTPTTEAQCAQLAKVKRSGGTFGTYKSDLVRGGYMAEARDGFELTELGWNEIGMAPGEAAPQTTDELLQLYAGTIRAGARRMVDALMEAYPEALTREELSVGAQVALEGGTFGTYLSDLRKAGLVEDSGDEIRASELLMNPAGASGG